jgi:tetratricopeptide (TPR) repeat protein
MINNNILKPACRVSAAIACIRKIALPAGIAALFITGAALISGPALADAVYSRNSKANSLYKQGKFEEALKLYDDALLESPEDRKLSINKGSALYKTGDFDKAVESYESALSVEDKKAKADCHYNLGNAFFGQGEQMQQSGNPAASEKYKAAYENYIKALDLRPKDIDAKHNLQLAYRRMQQMQQQQQNQDNDKNDKNDKDQKSDKNDKQQEKNQDQNKEEQKDKNDQQDQNKQNKQNAEQNKQEENQNKAPEPQQQEKQDLKKKEAERMLMQYADDDKLNKPEKKIRAVQAGTPEKDW